MIDKEKQQRYLEISKQITEQIGGKDNIVASTHCATRLRIVLKDYDKINKEAIDDIDLVKGEFVAGNQLQIVFGAGLVNEIYEVFGQYTGTAGASMAEVKAEAAKKMNPLQAIIKSLSDVFVDIMPGILAAALLSGLTGVLSRWEVVESNATLYAINRLVSLASNGIFSILPLAVCYSACKRYGGKPILGLVMGAIMLDASLANAYSAAQGQVEPEILQLFGLNIELVGFQGGIIIALMMGFVVAKLDVFFDKKIPDVVKLLLSPMCSVLISTILLFTIVGPAGRLLSNGITNGLIWMTQNLGIVGYMVFGGVQQIIVITGLHHIFGAIEAQLLADTGRNFLNPLMSVALMGQGGAVLGYLALNWKNNKAKELCIPSFISTLFGISEPAIFGINLRYKFPLVAGCIGGAIAGGYVFLSGLASLGFGTTAVPGLAICDPAGNGYINYIIAHLIALGVGLVLTAVFGKIASKKGA
ncbi:MAG TPA: PTS transporter subunit EIIC [Candidatus Butyricicoccus stercorigallinarum]|nr:PTS transporter subunit EIIC [Candidatus Butyricicoccus stercorigallinarum]